MEFETLDFIMFDHLSLKDLNAQTSSELEKTNPGFR